MRRVAKRPEVVAIVLPTTSGTPLVQQVWSHTLCKSTYGNNVIFCTTDFGTTSGPKQYVYAISVHVQRPDAPSPLDCKLAFVENFENSSSNRVR